MAQASPDVAAALATLRDRWGAAAPRRLIGPGEVVGALATVSLPDLPLPDLPLPAVVPGPAVIPGPAPAIGPPPERVVPTGFAAVDAILGPGGVPRQAGLAVRGDHSSGKTTLAMRLVAEAQASGSIVAWLDLGRSLDPVEAVARGVDLDWLVVLVPESLDEGLAMAGSLLQGHAVDLLVADLPPDRGARASRGKPAVADRLHRLGALARRADALLVVLEPPGLSGSMSGALAEVTGLRLELARRAWIRLGRDVVGQRTEVTVARNRFGAPGRRAEIQILYADGGERDACLDRADLLHDARPVSATAPPRRATGSFDAPASRSTEISIDATPSSSLAPSPSPPRPIPLHVVPDGGDRPGRPALDRGRSAGRKPGRPGSRRPAGDAARQRTSAGA